MKSRITAIAIVALTSVFTGSALASVEFKPTDDSVTSPLRCCRYREQVEAT